MPTKEQATSLQESNKAVVRRFIEEVINGKAHGSMADVMARDLTWHGGPFGEVRGLDAFTKTLEPFFAAFPDLHCTIEDLLADGDKVVLRMSWTATNKGPFLGAPATGKRVKVTGTSIYRVSRGQIAEEWWQEDLFGLAQQFGLLPRPA